MKEALAEFARIAESQVRKPVGEDRLHEAIAYNARKQKKDLYSCLKRLEDLIKGQNKALKRLEDLRKTDQEDFGSICTSVSMLLDHREAYKSAINALKESLDGEMGEMATALLERMDILRGATEKTASLLPKISQEHKKLVSEVRKNADSGRKSLESLKSDVVNRQMVSLDEFSAYKLLVDDIRESISTVQGTVMALAEAKKGKKISEKDLSELETRIRADLNSAFHRFPIQTTTKPGPTWFFGTTDPTTGTGANGDYAANTADNEFFKKIDGRWASQGSFTGGGGSTNIQNDIVGATGPTEWGAITPAPNGSATVFTVSNSAYTSGTLEVELNNAGFYGFTETTPASGTFTISPALPTGAILKVRYAHA